MLLLFLNAQQVGNCPVLVHGRTIIRLRHSWAGSLGDGLPGPGNNNVTERAVLGASRRGCSTPMRPNQGQSKNDEVSIYCIIGLWPLVGWRENVTMGNSGREGPCLMTRRVGCARVSRGAVAPFGNI